MSDIIITPNGTVRIKLDEGKLTFVMFSNGTFEIQTSPDVSPDERYVSFEGAVQLPEWLSKEISFAARVEYDRTAMKPIPDYGDHVTLEEFIEWCKSGYVTDYDGSGYYATESEVSGIPANPYEISTGVVNDKFTHVVWYNK